MCEHERAQHPSRPLFEGNWASAPEEEPGTTVRKPLEKVVPRSHWPWVGRPQGGPPSAPLWPGDSSTVMNFENMVHGQKLLEKMSKLFFPKDFETLKIFFLVFL